MKKFKNICLLMVLCMTFGAFIPVNVYAETSSDLQTYSNDEEIIVYLSAIDDEISSAEAQIGNITSAEIEILPANEYQDDFLHTTILFDNSLSIAEENRSVMKSIAKGIIQNHKEDEKFSLYTIDTDLRELSQNSDSYDELAAQVEAIEYVNQDTYLKNVLYDAFKNSDVTDGIYQRFIILSDGTDDNSVGYTYNDITRVLDEHHYTVCAIGSRYENKLDDLEDMFSIARAADSSYFLVDSSSNPEQIIEEINQNVPEYVAKITIPDAAKDGNSHKVRILLTAGENEYSIVSSVEMPFQILGESEETESAQTENEIATEEESQDQDTITKEKSNTLIEVIIPIIAIIIAVAVIIFNKLHRKKIEEKRLEEMSKQDDDDATVLMQSEEDDDDATVLMRHEDEDETYLVKTVVLRAENGSEEYQLKCSGETTIGRKNICDVQIQGDKSVSGVHCVITCDNNGNPVIRDNNSSNGTYLNDEKLLEKKVLETGDTLEIGRTRYSVQVL